MLYAISVYAKLKIKEKKRRKIKMSNTLESVTFLSMNGETKNAIEFYQKHKMYDNFLVIIWHYKY